MVDDIREGAIGETYPRKDEGLLLRKRLLALSIIIALQVFVVSFAGNLLIKPILIPENGEARKRNKGEKERGLIMLLEDIIVNLDGREAARYLRLSIGLEVDSEGASKEFRQRQPELRDIVISTLSGMHAEDLASREGKELLKVELEEKISAILQEGELINIYFSEFVGQ